MKENEKYVGKVKKHHSLGTVCVDKVHGNTRTKVEVTVLERGEGYDEIKDTYTGVKVKRGWYRGENREYGTRHVVHISELKREK